MVCLVRIVVWGQAAHPPSNPKRNLSDDNAHSAVSAQPPQQRLFVAFEGGGAKGLVHVGALKALESRSFQFSGVAGTSAGAIIAGLKAAGYEADEIANPKSGRTIFDKYRELTGHRLRPMDLFGPLGWKKPV
jgi:NTE family protein